MHNYNEHATVKRFWKILIRNELLEENEFPPIWPFLVHGIPGVLMRGSKTFTRIVGELSEIAVNGFHFRRSRDGIKSAPHVANHFEIRAWRRQSFDGNSRLINWKSGKFYTIINLYKILRFYCRWSLLLFCLWSSTVIIPIVQPSGIKFTRFDSSELIFHNVGFKLFVKLIVFAIFL
jgi:hypothetical protein